MKNTAILHVNLELTEEEYNKIVIALLNDNKNFTAIRFVMNWKNFTYGESIEFLKSFPEYTGI